MIASIPQYYAVRLVRGGVRVGVKVWRGPIMDPVTHEALDRGDRWQVEVNGEQVEPFSIIIELDGVSGEPVIKGERISITEYDYIKSVAAWAKTPGVDAPESEPRKAIDLNALPPIF